MFLKNRFSTDNLVNLIFFCIVGIILFFLVRYLSSVLVPFAIALLLLYLLNPIIEFFESKIKNRNIAVCITILLILIFVIGIFFIIIPKINNEIIETKKLILNLINNNLNSQVPDYTIKSYLWEKLKKILIENPKINYFVNTDNYQTLLMEVSKKIFPTFMYIISGTASFIAWIFGFLVICLYLIFMMFGFKRLKVDILTLIPFRMRASILNFILLFKDAMDNYFRGQLIVAFCVGVLFSMSFIIVGLPMAILLGIFFGILNIIPYMQILGYPLAFILVLLKTIQTGIPFWKTALYTAIAITAVQIIQDTILVPKILGSKTGLSPIMIILSLSIWGKLLGFFGFLIAIPITCLLLEYYKRFLNRDAH
ncbi:MAG: AI-2E family transporter [Elusimicrobiota bacterium]|jgi:predicted PurR-regulated permease PerM|nr:AI-2E family transporter [Elusimicrobiota bacterium]